MPEIFQYEFMIRAFIAGGVIACVAPLIGNFLVMRKYSLIADTLSHVALTGVAIAAILQTQPIVTTIIVTSLASLAIEKLRVSKKISGDAVLAMFLPGGLAIAVVLISITDGFNIGLFNYLFGSITTVTQQEVWLTLGLGTIVAISVMFFHKQLLAVAFDEEVAYVAGYDVNKLNTLLIILTAVTVSLAMRVVGVLLIGALLVVPVVTAMRLARSFRQCLTYSVFFGLISVIGGLVTAFYFDLPAGGIIVIISLGIYILAELLRSE